MQEAGQVVSAVAKQLKYSAGPHSPADIQRLCAEEASDFVLARCRGAFDMWGSCLGPEARAQKARSIASVAVAVFIAQDDWNVDLRNNCVETRP